MQTDVSHRHMHFYNGNSTVCYREDIIKPTLRCSFP